MLNLTQTRGIIKAETKKGGFIMPNIKPISDLRNYATVLETVQVGKPLYLTKNGRGCYTVMNIDEQEEQREKAEKYDRMQAQLRLMCELAEGRRSGEEEGWISSEDVRNHFRGPCECKVKSTILREH